MHIQDVMLLRTTPGVAVAVAGFVLTGVGTAIGLRKIDYEQMPRVGLLSAVFFVATFIHVQIGPANVHLVLNGLMGLILGWAAFPALLVALLLQAVFMQFGGLTALGINTLTMALPAVLCHYLFHRAIAAQSSGRVFWGGVAAGATAIVLSLVLVAGACYLADPAYKGIAGAFIAASLFLAVGEGLVTGSAVLFLRKVAPEVLQTPVIETAAIEASHV